ncbi:hypothetical protein Sipo8835_08455 [Streptomyces ipomoeae]|jgi:hypothetical protein|uniref:Uncharacterized protein n=2 Tax=Streptomyces ipomoeae TaxID=103232 RepID=L1KTP3_9ACTN|nr:hypothetical protein [Streptomyces ipomoeae]EKX63758.1 hypothetical protein STRIP9103_07826 [Streptomyces ipomoeae 91-03]MDX2700050.1 hypothetical protein [Streptomyces ipomoeae]MDX2826366.1 hypothetical protein [Streptomyces ipomoeae]MDX2845696.1 hypothetical protein [Streptomyces ipomoeae]MDX2879035.1 hypothetical protein [Streptomyces ipomoeae]
MNPIAAPDPVTQLKAARRLIEERYADEQPLIRAALHLIDCATDIVAVLPEPDLDACRDALGSARAAVVSATFAVGRVRDLAAADTKRA